MKRERTMRRLVIIAVVLALATTARAQQPTHDSEARSAALADTMGPTARTVMLAHTNSISSAEKGVALAGAGLIVAGVLGIASANKAYYPVRPYGGPGPGPDTSGEERKARNRARQPWIMLCITGGSVLFVLIADVATGTRH
jgi:hypothetical protein